MIAPIEEDDEGCNPGTEQATGNPNQDEGGQEKKQPVCHVTSDGLLALTIVEDTDGESLIGFHGFEWNVQISELSELSGVSRPQALQDFLDDLFHDRSLIAVLSRRGEVVDAWITDDPQIDLQYIQEGEQLSFRYWSGTEVQF